jgi:DNA-binding response OmpR family regulator
MEKKVKLLLAEDDENLGLLLKEYLIAKGYETDLYPDGEAAYKGFTKNQSYSLCIIFLTAKNMKEDVLEGFKIGADDYITKPFSMEELIFRIEAIMRRVSQDSNSHEDAVYKLGIYTFDSRKQILTGGEEEVKLTTKESELLKLLCNNANKVLERNFALKTIWIDDNYFNARSMDVYITKLRKHLKDDPKVEIINVHGKGYKLIM